MGGTRTSPQPLDELPPEPWEPLDDPESCELPEDPEPCEPRGPGAVRAARGPGAVRGARTARRPEPERPEPDFELDELELEADELDFEPELLEEVDFELEWDFEADSWEEPEDWCEELDCCEDVELLERPVMPADASRDCTRALTWLATDPPLDVERGDVVSPEPPRSGEDRPPDRGRELASAFHADAAREPLAEELSWEPLRVPEGRSTLAGDVESSCVPLAPAPVLAPVGQSRSPSARPRCSLLTRVLGPARRAGPAAARPPRPGCRPGRPHPSTRRPESARPRQQSALGLVGSDRRRSKRHPPCCGTRASCCEPFLPGGSRPRCRRPTGRGESPRRGRRRCRRRRPARGPRPGSSAHHH